MSVQDFMATTVTTVTPETLVRMAYQVMRDARIRHLPVVTAEGTLVGIITDRDIRRAAASDVPHLAEHELLSQLEQLRVRDIMTPEVVTVGGTTWTTSIFPGSADRAYVLPIKRSIRSAEALEVGDVATVTVELLEL